MSVRLRLTADSLRELAEVSGVCIRPVLHEVHDTVTGKTHLVPTPCGATRETKCPPCAVKNRRLRMQQCREGWHLDREPEPDERQSEQDDLEPEVDPDVVEDESARRTRSTRRRQDAPDLPSLPVEQRTIGAAFTTPAGHTYRPSMFLTVTLPSYGRVRADGTPYDAAKYDYRRAALDAMHFPKAVDRLWQNLRRSTGFQVQYFSAVEEQRRLAPHLHAAIRGAIPRALLRQVVRATYHQVWWPPHHTAEFYEGRYPVWSADLGYVDPKSGEALPTWDEALDRLDADPEARPAHVVRFGQQLDIQGIIATEGDADRRVAYLTKYLSKAISDTYDAEDASPAQLRHMHKLHEQVRLLPCSPRCWNWLRYGVQPQGAEEGMCPGRCPGKAHDFENLGLGGRRVLVSRKWTGKTLKEHKADRASVVRQVLSEAGVDVESTERMAADVMRPDGLPRFSWRVWDPLDAAAPVYRQVMTRSIAEKLRWRSQYDAAKQRVSASGAPTENAPSRLAGPVSTTAPRPPRQPARPGCRSGGQG